MPAMDDITSNKSYNVIVIGAGWSGLNFAKNYLDVYPSRRVLLVDSQKSLGGIWAKERIYPGLNLQSSKYIFRFPELDPDSINPKFTKHGFLTSEGMNQYMEAYADKFNLHQHILLQTTVQHARKREGVNNGWDVHILGEKDDRDQAKSKVLFCEQLVVAQGFAPTPNIPESIPCSEFKGIISHTKDVGQVFDQLIKPSASSSILKDEVTTITTITASASSLTDNNDRIAVYGAGKSAYDIIAALASRGKKIVWIIRGEGRGPGWLMSPFADGEKKKVYADTMASKKIFGMLFPCMYQDDGYGWLHALFCRTWLGRKLTSLIFKTAHKDGMKQYGTLPQGLEWLEPSVAPAGGNNYDFTLGDYLRDGTITVINDTITSLSDHTVKLKSNPPLTNITGLIWGTGYKVRCPIFAESDKYTYGVPTTLTSSQQTDWNNLNTRAEKVVLEQNPFLADPPPHAPSPIDIPRWNLYRLMVSPKLAKQGDNSLIFLGQAPSVATGLVSAIQSVWAVAYLSGRIEIPDDVEWQTAVEMAYIKKRNLGWFDAMMLNMDALNYATKLNLDIGMNPHFKGRWWIDLFSTYKPADFAGWINKWSAKEGIKQE